MNIGIGSTPTAPARADGLLSHAEPNHAGCCARQKIEAVEEFVSVRRSLVGRCAAIGMMQQRIADLFDCCESQPQGL